MPLPVQARSHHCQFLNPPSVLLLVEELGCSSQLLLLNQSSTRFLGAESGLPEKHSGKNDAKGLPQPSTEWAIGHEDGDAITGIASAVDTASLLMLVL